MFGAERAAAPTTTVLTETPTLGKTALPSLTVEVPAVPQDDVARNAFDQRARLRAMVTYQATLNQTRLKAALMNATSPQARLALLRAIAVSETGYEKALMSLEDQQ
jgi:hypothetical protein